MMTHQAQLTNARMEAGGEILPLTIGDIDWARTTALNLFRDLDAAITRIESRFDKDPLTGKAREITSLVSSINAIGILLQAALDELEERRAEAAA